MITMIRATVGVTALATVGVTALASLVLTGCDGPRSRGGDDVPGTAGRSTGPDTPAASFMANLAAQCSGHFPGRLVLEPEGDPMLTGTELLVVHFLDCDADEVRIPFHIEGDDGGWDRSRTWHVIRHGDRMELRHDHREPDGSESARTWYGGFTEAPGTATQQDFVSPERSAAAGVTVGWRIEIEPGVRYAYGTTHDGEYDWRIEFDLGRPLAGPAPLRWGHDRAPSRVPGPP
jgi:hypothetical protein